jgi:hypothetical protein
MHKFSAIIFKQIKKNTDHRRILVASGKNQVQDAFPVISCSLVGLVV